MDILYTLLAVTVSLLSVFGLWCAFRLFLDAFRASGKVVTAIEINNRKDAEMLDVLLHEAHSAFFCQTNARTLVLIESSLLYGCLGTDGVPSPETLELLACFGARYRVV